MQQLGADGLILRSHPWGDAHCHLADLRDGWSPDAAISRAGARGVSFFVQGGICSSDWERQCGLADRYPGQILPVAGLHPVWVAEHSDEEVDQELQRLEVALRSGRFFAVGELGLDARGRYASAPQWKRQERAFQRQLESARRFQRPLVLHVVRAHERARELLSIAPLWTRPGIVHSFSGTAEDAVDYSARGFLLSVSGGNFRGALGRLKEAIRRVPPEVWVLETDAPDQCHPEWPGPWSEPAHLLEVAAWMAPLLGLTPEALLDASAERLKRCLTPGLNFF